jgi:arabinose-5-phosphate isomerase
MESQINSIQYTYDNLDEKVMNNFYLTVKKTLVNGNKIVVSGLGKNVPIAEKFVGTMLSLGMKAAFLHTNTAMHGDLGVVDDEDLVLLLSKSGNTAETIHLAKHLVKYNINFYGISFNDNQSKLYQLCKENNYISLKLNSEGDEWDLVPNNSSVTYLIILQALSIQLMKDFKIEKKVFERNHPGGAIGEKL